MRLNREINISIVQGIPVDDTFEFRFRTTPLSQNSLRVHEERVLNTLCKSVSSSPVNAMNSIRAEVVSVHY